MCLKSAIKGSVSAGICPVIVIATLAVALGIGTLPACAKAQGAGSYRTVSKSCEKCGGAVSVSAKVGDTCPHCGVRWGVEKNTYSQSSSLPSSPRRSARSRRDDGEASDLAVMRYRWNSRSGGRAPSHDLVLTDVRDDDGSVIKTFRAARDGGGDVSMDISLDATGNQQSVSYAFDTPGARNIRLEIDDVVRETRYAGLRFRSACTVAVRQDGTVTVDQTDLSVEDLTGKLWSSRSVALGSQRVNVFMPAIRQPVAVAPQAVWVDPGVGDGRNQVAVSNPKAHSVEVTFRDGDFEQVFTLAGRAQRTFYLPDGRFETFFTFLNDPTAQYQGARLNLNGTRAYIVLSMTRGNTVLRRLK